ncbi:MAG: hypothetical protein HZA50_19570 [Planctomycetes bacterium]|nr:hypothetical protein [Planctomycetota bacterium]
MAFLSPAYFEPMCLRIIDAAMPILSPVGRKICRLVACQDFALNGKKGCHGRISLRPCAFFISTRIFFSHVDKVRLNL